MLRHTLLVLLGALIVLPIGAGLVGVKVRQFQAMAEAGAAFVMPPEIVNAIAVQEAQWQPRVRSVGTVVASQGTQVRAEVEGLIRSVHFESGARAKAGDILLKLDTDLEEAQLKEAEVAADWARTALKRARELNKSRNISQAELDEAENALRQAEARLHYMRTVIEKKTLRAPFDGQLGIKQVSNGQFLEKGGVVVSLQALNPVYVEFSVPQQQVGIVQKGLNVTVTTDAYPEQTFDGRVTAINPDIDLATRSLRVQATLANPDGRLRPGMFVTLETRLQKHETVLLIPLTAVQHGPYGDSVFLIEEGEPADDGQRPLVTRQQRIKLGARQGDFVVVTEGLKAGEQIVSTGGFKLRPGIQVVIDNRLAPDFQLEPRPDNT